MVGDIEELTRDKIPGILLNAEKPVIIDVWGPECAPCIALAPTFQALADRFSSDALFMKLEAPANRMACVDLKVIGLPTFLRFEGGNEVDRLTGDISDGRLSEWVEQALSRDNLKGGE